MTNHNFIVNCDIFSSIFVYLIITSTLILFLSRSLCLSIYLSVYLSISLPVSLPVYLSLCLSPCLSIYLSACVHVCLSPCLSLCLSPCLPVYLPLSLLASSSIFNILSRPVNQPCDSRPRMHSATLNSPASPSNYQPQTTGGIPIQPM